MSSRICKTLDKFYVSSVLLKMFTTINLRQIYFVVDIF